VTYFATIPLLLLAAQGGDAGRSAVDVFREACMGGQTRLTNAEVRPIPRKALAPAIRRYLSSWPAHLTADAQYYALSLPEGAGFVVVNRNGAIGDYCSVSSQHIKYWDARVAVDQHPANLLKISASERRKMVRMGHHRTISSLGYRIVVRRIDEGFITMTTYLPNGKTVN